MKSKAPAKEYSPTPGEAQEIERQLRAIRRGAVDLVSEEGLRVKLLRSLRSKRPLRVKLGIDPSSPDLHLGHVIPLLKLRAFQDLGHQAVLILGDGTGRIGDPTGRNKTRPQLTKEEVEQFGATYLEQAERVLLLRQERCPAGALPVEVVHNGDWFGKMDFFDTVKLASRMTVARMLERDYFQERWKAGTEIRLHEMLYPLMQGWDSVMVRSDVELGGTDQLFNLLVGRDFQEQEGQEAQICLTTPLLEGTDGRKMSKSYGNAIGIAENATEMFGKCMSIPDTQMKSYFVLLTNVAEEEIATLLAGHPREAKARLGKEIVARFQGKDAANAAAAEFDRVFRDREKPQDIPEFHAPAKTTAIDLLLLTGFASSRSDARRLVQQGGVKIDDSKVATPEQSLEIHDAGILMQAGKRRFAKIFPRKGD